MAVTLAVVSLVAGCAGRRIQHGVFRSEKGYRVTIPGPAWRVVDASRADLELEHAAGGAGIVVNATCDATARHPLPVLRNRLLLGLRDRRVLAAGQVSVDGARGLRTELEARLPGGRAPRRIEALVLADDRCVYDLIHAAVPEAFEATRPDFARLVGSFRRGE